MQDLGPRETNVLSDIASKLYDWLPGSSPPFGQTYTLADAAAACGLGEYWIGGSKIPALQRLLQAAYVKGMLGSLVLRITTEGIKYRNKKRNALTREEIETVNELLLLVRLKIPALRDSEFLASLPRKETKTPPNTVSRIKLDGLLKRYNLIEKNPDLQSRGYELQDLLRDLFDACGLQPKGPFRVVGEEIDGSFILDGETYLLEARWRKNKIDASALSSFSGKVERKSAWTRGLFVSMSGFSEDAIEAIGKGKPVAFILMSEDELLNVLKAETNLPHLLREKVRDLAERGQLQ